ncbi:MAG: hypothetical protein A2360_01395 [Candidatus Staskawiczbacteria bacterium RIFOXYB1_FULL_32_11]|nr:MAG: hypothetical protein A2360_01395 [Candidatus Staskawiczbacteria bacterium RIFOXYB1_FULL_32_11]
MNNLNLLMITLGSLLSLNGHANIAYGLVHLEIPSQIESACIFPDHGGGYWVCREHSFELFHTATSASEIRIRNLSVPVSVQEHFVFSNLEPKQTVEITLIDSRDQKHKGLIMVEGKNQLELSIYQNKTLLDKQVIIIDFMQFNDF